MRRHLPALGFYLAAFLACVWISACSGSARQKTLRASVLAVNVARDGLLAYDKTHQLEIVDKAGSRDEAQANLAAYHVRRAVVVSAFEIAYQALALAATASDDPSFEEAMRAASAVLDAVKALTGGT